MERTKLIYVCSPFRGDSQKNLIRANLHSRFVYEKGYIPIAPHTIFTQFLDEENPTERKSGVDMGLRLLELCDELWVFGWRISVGMKQEIEFARKNNIVTKYISEEMEEE